VCECICVHITFSLLIYQLWAPRLTPQLGSCEQSCYKHGCTGVSLVCSVILLCLRVSGRVTGGSSVSFLRRLHSDFHSGCPNSHSQQHRMRFLFPHSRQLSLVACVLMTATLTGVRRNLRVFLLCISFVAKDSECSLCIYWSTCPSSEN
jgi:hypothetical protein